MPTIRQGATGLRDSTYTTNESVTALNAGLGAQEALALTVAAETEDFTYAATTEDGEGGGATMDDEPGIIAQWSAEEVKRVRVIGDVEVFDVALGGVIEGDLVAVQIWVNEVSVLDSDKGSIDVVEATGEFLFDNVINIRGRDVIRLVLEAGAASEAGQYDVAGELQLDFIAVD